MSMKLLIVAIFLLIPFISLAKEVKDSSFVRVLIGDLRPTKDEVERVRKIRGLANVGGLVYKGEIEVWRGKEGYFLVNVVSLEEYVKGVVSSEVGINWPEEALKAQAVLARTYAYFHILQNRGKNFYDLTSSLFHQVFKGSSEAESVDKAVKDTEGEILIFNGEPIRALYHACSVTKTESAKDVFGVDQPYLRAIEVPNTPSPYSHWERKITFDTLRKTLSLSKVTEVEILSYTQSGRVNEIRFSDGKNSKVVKATELRRLLKWTPLPSTMIRSVRVEQDGVVFEGNGFGHGVGMCQWCAFQMAQDGKNYREILQYFYPGTQLVRIDEIK